MRVVSSPQDAATSAASAMPNVSAWSRGRIRGLSAQKARIASGPESPTAGTVRLPDFIVFGAARDDRARLDTPNAVSVVAGEAIRRRQPSTYAELLDDVPGLTIGSGPRGVSQEVNIRGFQNEQVVLRVDGARQNFNLAQRGRFFTDPMILKQIEPLRGGASTLFGSGALGEVMFVDTEDARDVIDQGQTVGGEVKLGTSSNGEELSYGATGAVQHGAFDALVFLSGRDRGRGPNGSLQSTRQSIIRASSSWTRPTICPSFRSKKLRITPLQHSP